VTKKRNPFIKITIPNQRKKFKEKAQLLKITTSWLNSNPTSTSNPSPALECISVVV